MKDKNDTTRCKSRNYFVSAGFGFGTASASGRGLLGVALMSPCTGVLADGGGARGAFEVAAEVAIRWSNAFNAIALNSWVR